ncbi:MAG: hypothetical protein IKQ43_08020 [Treponema sp.]|jgi:uncharacterized protein YgiM (DUF1202 family)|nr:hypothetical protein [Treponema sp.]MBR7080260.1 hypothetical protein [Treponema sp.]
MKKGILALLIAFCSFSVFAASFKSGETVYVSTKSVQLKSTDGSFSSNSGLAVYGDMAKVLSVNGKKVKIQLSTGSKSTGWIAQGNLSKKKINKDSKTTASNSELALAGKGWSQEAENAYKASNTKLNFKVVDAIEAIIVKEAEVAQFIKEGHLMGAE